MTRRRSRKRTGKCHLAGWLLLESIAAVAFLGTWMVAESHRDDSPLSSTPKASSIAEREVAVAPTADRWQHHRPRFSQLVGDLWEAGF